MKTILILSVLVIITTPYCYSAAIEDTAIDTSTGGIATNEQFDLSDFFPNGGEPGEKGEPGPPGDKGEPGPPGDKGEQGPPGDKGEQGPPGDKGEQGPTGDKGEQGSPGDKGEQGMTGDKGEQGSPGDKGEQGQTGDKGEQGPPGDKGDQGPTGDKGPQGPPGDKGEQGSPGEKGEQGPPGDKGEQGPASGGGAMYVRWGRTVCPNTDGTELVYKGLAGGSWFDGHGGGANYICLIDRENIEYLSTKIPSHYTHLYGAEYQSPVMSESLNNNNAPCVVCHTSERSSKLMIPGTTSCPTSWTEEYEGYLMTEYYFHKTNKVFECVDKDAEAVPGEAGDTGGALFYHVGARCDVASGLPCPPLVANRPITCVVCTK